MGQVMHQFVGHLMTFGKNGEGDEIVDEDVLIEVTEVLKDGQVEFAFTDRNERCYLKLNIGDLTQRMCLLVGNKLDGE